MVDKELDQFHLPIYLKTVSSNSRSEWKIGETYDVSNGLGKPAETFMLISSIRVDNVSQIPDVLMAYITEEREKDEAIRLIEDKVSTVEEIVILVMLRIDSAKDFVINGIESIDSESYK